MLKRSWLLLSIFLVCFPVYAITHLATPGSYVVRVMDFPDIKDNERGGRSVPMKLHIPEMRGQIPLVVLSHGAGGTRDSYYAQAQHLASHGFAVLAVEHVGSNTARMKSSIRFAKNLKNMTRDSNEVLNRPRDVSFAIDQAERWDQSHPLLKGKFDLQRVGVMGHSFGAFTTLVVCGARPALNWMKPVVMPGKGLGPDLSDKRVKACVALSPQGPGEPYFIESSYAGLTRPVLGISGTRDRAQSESPELRKRFFELEPEKDKVFIWIGNADHLSFADATGSGARNMRSRGRKDVQPIVRVSTLLFFKRYLQGNTQADAMLSEKSLKPLLHGVVKRVEVYRK